MIYGNVPMMIFILATGYLFTVYLLLALAKRSSKNSPRKSVNLATDNQDIRNRKISIRQKVTEAVNSQ